MIYLFIAFLIEIQTLTSDNILEGYSMAAKTISPALVRAIKNKNKNK